MSDSDLSPGTLAALERHSFPNHFTCWFDYFATGEGRSVWLAIIRAGSKDELTSVIGDQVEPHFRAGVEIRQGPISSPFPKLFEYSISNLAQGSNASITLQFRCHYNYF